MLFNIKNKIFVLLIFFSGSVFADCHSVDELINQLMQKNKINGVAVTVIKRGNVEFCNYGYISANKDQKVDQHTIFDIASISKTFTATLAGIAAAQGIFDLQKPINEYVNTLNTNQYKNINSQELLAHVSGLDFTQETNFKQTSQTNFINTLNKTKSRHLPGTYYQYGQVGISLVAIALEKVYKQPFDDILRQQLLNKLEMKETFINVPSSYKNIATGYDQNNKPVAPFNIGILTPAGGLKSSSYDLAKYLQLQLNATNPLFIKALNLVHKNYYCLYPDGTYQQLAWVYHPQNDLTTTFKPGANSAAHFKPQKLAEHCAYDANGFIEKSGNSNGMSLYILYMPSNAIGVIVLTNKARVADSVNVGRSILNQAK